MWACVFPDDFRIDEADKNIFLLSQSPVTSSRRSAAAPSERRNENTARHPLPFSGRATPPDEALLARDRWLLDSASILPDWHGLC
jgi:hypothetical protein